jgi:peptidyl-prolyl cis-trans isomerase A (cyclophilin A)
MTRARWLPLTLLLGSCTHHSPLLQPTPKDLAWTAPDSFVVAFSTSRGTFDITAHRDWSPLAVDRFHFLVTQRYYDGARFFRVIPGFVVQWGISGDPAVNAVWAERTVPDEPVRRSNTRGRVSYARGGPNTRGVQLYVNLGNNARLDTLNTFGFPPIGEVTSGLERVDSMYAGYGCRRGGQGGCPDQDSIQTAGNAFLRRAYPMLDSILAARVTRVWGRSTRKP